MTSRRPSHSEPKNSKKGSSKTRKKRSSQGENPNLKQSRYKLRKAPTNPKSLGERVRVARTALGLTQTELADLMYSDQTTVSAWEVAKAVPSGAALGALSLILKNSVETLKTGKGFHLPEPFKGSASLKASDIYAANHVILPAPPKDAETLWIDLSDERNPKPLSFAKAQEALRKARQKGRSVWVVVG